MENNTPTRIHPLVAGAAISVMLVSLTGVAAITGLIPKSHSTATPAGTPVAASVGAATAAASPAALVENKEAESKAESKGEETPAPAAKSAPPEKRSYAPRTAQASQHQPRRAYNEPAPRVAQGPAICHSCGRVESVQVIEQPAQPSGIGMVAGAVLGGVLGNQVGGGSGRKIATVAGAVGGGYAGNEIEKRSRSTASYQVRVRMEDGDIRTFPYSQQPGWSVGDRVRVVDGKLTSRA